MQNKYRKEDYLKFSKLMVTSYCDKEITECTFIEGSKFVLRSISCFEKVEMSMALLMVVAPELPSLIDWDYDLLTEILELLDYSK